MSFSLGTQVFWTAKYGAPPDDYEDSTAIDGERGLFAISDGATESSFAKEWAQILTAGFVAGPGCLSGTTRGRSRKRKVAEWLLPLQKIWQEKIDTKDLAWHAKRKIAEKGDYATFLGLRIASSARSVNAVRWQSIAMGDCELFHIRNDEMDIAFPLNRSRDFGIDPSLFYSRPQMNQYVLDNIRVRKGIGHLRDQFFLCSDALAKWFLSQVEAGEKPWSVLDSLASNNDFEYFINKLRDAHLVRNDDTTLVIITIN